MRPDRNPKPMQLLKRTLLIAFIVGATIGAAAYIRRHPLASNVVATLETQSVHSSGDAADDPAVWVHPTDPTKSTIIGTDKKRGLVVWDLDGKQIQEMELGHTNNVDVQDEVRFGSETFSLVGTSERLVDQVILFRVDPATRLLTPFEDHSFKVSVNPGGVTFYRSPKSGRLFVFVVGEDHEDKSKNAFQQWEIIEQPEDSPTPFRYEKVRHVRIETDAEGLVADDELGYLFVSEENTAVWRFDAEPDGGDTRFEVDSFGYFGHLNHDVEGLAIYRTGPKTGYLMVCCQGTDDFVVLRREGDHEYVGRFEIVAGNGIDQVLHTDGICATSTPLGERFPEGIFVAQDDEDESGRQNFKVVSWVQIREKLE